MPRSVGSDWIARSIALPGVGGLVVEQPGLGEPAQQRREHDVPLQAGQGGTEAVVRAERQRQVLALVGAGDVEPVGVGAPLVRGCSD